MFLQTRRYQKRLQYLNNQSEAALVIQKYYRGYRVRRQKRNRELLWSDSTKEIIKIQSWMRMMIARLRYMRQLEHYRKNEHYIVRIQAWWRGCYIRNDYQGKVENLAFC